jgi:hypothetical protein
MITFTKDDTMTLTATSGLEIPNGTVIKGKVKPFGSLNGTINYDIEWTINDFADLIQFKELPASMFSSIPCFNEDGSEIYTFPVVMDNHSPVYSTIYISTQILIAFIVSVEPEFDGKISIIEVPLV